MRNLIVKIQNFMLLSVLLPFVYGCNGGGGDSASVGSLFGDVSSAAGGTTSSAAGDALASVHQPEPATMLLIGGGLLALSYIESKKKR